MDGGSWVWVEVRVSSSIIVTVHIITQRRKLMIDTFVYNMVAELQDNVLSTIQLIPMEDEYYDVTEALQEINIMLDDVLVELEEEI